MQGRGRTFRMHASSGQILPLTRENGEVAIWCCGIGLCFLYEHIFCKRGGVM